MYKTKIKIISDACCKIPDAHIKGRASFGPAACGFIILDENDQILAKDSQYLGDMTVPQAELKGLICALEEIEADKLANAEFIKNHS